MHLTEYNLNLLLVAVSDGHVQIQLSVLQYDNPLGTSYHGADFHSDRKCCDKENIDQCSTTDSCDTYIVFCIGGIRDGKCVGPSVQTEPELNKNSWSVSYYDSKVYSFTWDNWTSNSTEYVANVMDKDSSGFDLVANFTKFLQLNPDLSYEQSSLHILSFQNQVSLDVGIRVWCEDGYTGTECSRKCTDDVFHVCSDTGGSTLAPSCSKGILDLTMMFGRFVPVNFTPAELKATLMSFAIQEMCSLATAIDITIIHFSLTRPVEFNVSCDGRQIDGLQFNTHLYILSLTDKSALQKYFPQGTLKIPSVTQTNIRGAHMLMMVNIVGYEDSSFRCAQQSCDVKFSLCIHEEGRTTGVSCEANLEFSAAMNSTSMTICDGQLVSSPGPIQAHHTMTLVGVAHWPAVHVDVKYNNQQSWSKEGPALPTSYKAGKPYHEALTQRITIFSDDKTKRLDLEIMLWCSLGHSGDKCQHTCSDSGNQMCDENGHLTCKQGYLFSQSGCHDVNDCETHSSCHNGGTCHNTEGSYTCDCRAGWTGPTCDIDIDECALGYCVNASECTNKPGSFLCRCSPGYHGRYCIDNDECRSPTKPCKHGVCLNTLGSYGCLCPEEYAGTNCDEDVDECKINPTICGSHGVVCTNTNGSFNCFCTDGWTGKTCQVDIDECVTHPCVHGICINTQGNFTCACNRGYTGLHCDQDYDECAENFDICANNGTCINLPPGQGYFRCDCQEGWDSRSRCTHPTDACKVLHPCVHGTCINDDGFYICACEDGWEGQNCSLDVDECKENMNPCRNNGTCSNTIGGYLCYCESGWTGSNCSVDLDECNNYPCQNNATCQNNNGRYTCTCNNGWEGENCSTDIDECAKYHPCKHNATCQNNNGRYTCTCNNGWEGENCSTDIDECAKYHPCQHNATCQNNNGGYTCTCNNDWEGKNCSTDIDECAKYHPCQHNATCQNSNGGYTCSCNNGWEGGNCSVDVDECAKFHPCKNNATCHNNNGGYSCTCKAGWEGVNCSVDVDECAKYHPCQNNATCHNNNGGYTCTCKTGWEGKNCSVDVDECAKYHPCQKNATCHNNNGGYTCTCKVGWEGVNCSVDIDECATYQPCQHNATCHNNNGGYTCWCTNGWEGNNCSLDVNECYKNHPCQNNATCHNDNSGYVCKCQNGWKGANCSVDIDECAENHLCQRNATCRNLNGSYKTICDNGDCYNEVGGYQCRCWQGWQGTNCDEDINECFSMPCLNHGSCQNEFGKYLCICRTGWTGLLCQQDIDECLTDPCENQGTCTNYPGDFSCACMYGFSGVNCSTSSTTLDPTLDTTSKEADMFESTNHLTKTTVSLKDYSSIIPQIKSDNSTANFDITVYNGEHISNSTPLSSLTWNHTTSLMKLTKTTLPTMTSFTEQQSTTAQEYTQFSTVTRINKVNTSPRTFGIQLKDAIHPDCSNTGWNISVNFTILKMLYSGITPFQVYFGDTSCRGQNNGELIVFQQGFRDCLTNERVSGETLIYENSLFYAIFDPINPFIIRRHEWTYTIECDIRRNQVMSSHVHHDVNSNHASVPGHYDSKMAFYTDANFQNEITDIPIHARIGDYIYVKVFTMATDWTIKLRLHTCYTKPSEESDDKMNYFLIKDGCEVDANTHIISQSTHETRFVFQDFEYATNKEGLNIYCNTTFCESNDYSPACIQSCLSPGTQTLIGK